MLYTGMHMQDYWNVHLRCAGTMLVFFPKRRQTKEQAIRPCSARLPVATRATEGGRLNGWPKSHPETATSQHGRTPG